MVVFVLRELVGFGSSPSVWFSMGSKLWSLLGLVFVRAPTKNDKATRCHRCVGQGSMSYIEKALSIEGRHAPRSSTGDGLSIHRVSNVARCEDPGNIGH